VFVTFLDKGPGCASIVQHKEVIDMELVPWKPFGEVSSFRGEMDKLYFRIPVNVKTDKVEAVFDKGVLKVTLPKVEEAKKKEIEIKVK
jgi:hypothetical protein